MTSFARFDQDFIGQRFVPVFSRQHGITW
jgi:hypothetical protein